jgi:hypothetical protein
MTTEVRTLLHDAADVPIRAPDLERARESARIRRRRRRGVGALAAVVVLVLVTAAVAVRSGGGGDGAHVAIGPRQTNSTVPDGWKTIHADPGITVSVPAAWKVGQGNATPIGVPVLSLEDLDPLADDALAACFLGRTPVSAPEEGGSLINMWEFPASSNEVPGTADDVLTVVDRPTTFSGALTLGPRTCPVAEYQQIAFRDAGRVFLVRAVSVIPSNAENPELLALAAQVLDTLKIEPLDDSATPTTTEVASPPLPSIPPTATTAPPFVPTSADEQQIADLVARWLTYQSDDEIRATIQGADSILDAMHEGMRQYQMNLSAYSGRADAVHLVDDSHADIVFTLFLNGGVLYGNQHGHAVKVDGRWMMTRDSECSLLALGSISCPS